MEREQSQSSTSGPRARPRTLGLLIAGLAFSTVSAQELAPQPPKQPGGFFVPMLTVGETLDDNLFFTPFPESDFVTRVGLGLQAGYRSTPFTLDVQASRAGDFFERHPDFNTTRARTLGQLALTWMPARSLTVSLFGCYFDTKTPSELNLLSGLALGRSLATRYSGAPALEYRLGSRSTLTGAYPVAHDILDGRITDTRTGVLGFDRRVTKQDTLSFRYERRLFSFSGSYIPEESTADVFTVGWMAEVGEHTLVLVRAGPRYAKGEYTPEVLGTVKHRVKRGLVTVTYSKTQATTLGKSGALDTQSLAGTLALRVAKRLEIASGPGVYRNSLRGQNLYAVRLNVETLWHFSPWFHLGAGYTLDVQQPDFGAPGHIRRGAFQVRLLSSPEQRRPEDLITDASPQGTE